ncbi:MASE1 domain-containing protein [Kitasatospora sp. YST-16]|uniref:MASE1 domain-containing protein n=1 Tax=unclassified Kitasatospora TaxID=2633591 RepID=UPI0006909A96|nr:MULTISPECIES: MASE1 domain-containing protein [unclassified Kitasatospora]WAL70478.1 MASE1 domain-containing protein [Kitasatospora sp. YST-16]WNW36517.1 MASE1 domain-containing protein [Streptomyces sp. Li-HN-5-13]
MAAVLRNAKAGETAVAGLSILGVALVYWAGGRLGLLTQVVVGGVHVTPLWPPTGVAVAGLLLLGLRVWPGIALGALLVIAGFGAITPASFGIAAGNTLAPVVAVLLLARVGFRVELDRLRDGVALVFLGALVSTLISASTACLLLVSEGALAAHQFWPAWTAWWTGDAMGVLVVAPLLLAVRAARMPRDVPLRRWAEALGLLAVTAVTVLTATRSPLSLLFLVLPVVMWAALRFQLLGAAPCVLVVSVFAVPAAVHHIGPFAHHGLLAVMVQLQALNGVAALTGLLLAAVTTERENTLDTIEQACIALAEVVNRLAPGEADGPWPPPADPRRPG